MSIFSKQIKDLEFSDIEDLLKEKVCENIRLEFKSQAPDKEEMIKKLSSFANTYGGYLVIGVAEDGKGCIKAIPGVSPKERYDQTIVQWCFEEVYPPLQPIVSSPIPPPDNSGKVFYVTYMEESMEAPHFLTKRRGAYIRTDEYSQKFEARLATWENLQFLANRRRKAEEKREFLLDRTYRHFKDSPILSEYERTHSHKPASFLKQVLVPLFPTQPGLEYQMLKNSVIDNTLWVRGVHMPSEEKLHTQFESIIFENAKGSFSYLEVNIHRLIYYAEPVSSVSTDESKINIAMGKVLGLVIMYLKYASKFYRETGFEGMLRIQLILDNLKGKTIWFTNEGADAIHSYSFLDNEVILNRDVPAHLLCQNISKIAKDLFRELGYSCGWQWAFDAKEEYMDKLIEEALRYLMVDKSFLEEVQSCH